MCTLNNNIDYKSVMEKFTNTIEQSNSIIVYKHGTIIMPNIRNMFYKDNYLKKIELRTDIVTAVSRKNLTIFVLKDGTVLMTEKRTYLNIRTEPINECSNLYIVKNFRLNVYPSLFSRCIEIVNSNKKKYPIHILPKDISKYIN